jgi:hypothetical protein
VPRPPIAFSSVRDEGLAGLQVLLGTALSYLGEALAGKRGSFDCISARERADGRLS